MNYRARFTAKSRGEFYEAARWWAEHRDVDQAARWIDEFQAAIDGLGENPQRHAVIRETDLYDWKYTYRRLLFGLGKKATHRAVFRVQDDAVYIVTVRHLSQREIEPPDVE